jgi:hypothetical protein
MAKKWVLDTETKGTGAHIAPLEAERERERERDLDLVTFERPPRPAAAPAPREPLRLKVIDVLGARVLGEDIDVREAVRLLEGMRSSLDARVYARDRQTGRWRLLSLEQVKALWHFRRAEPN